MSTANTVESAGRFAHELSSATLTWAGVAGRCAAVRIGGRLDHRLRDALAERGRPVVVLRAVRRLQQVHRIGIDGRHRHRLAAARCGLVNEANDGSEHGIRSASVRPWESAIWVVAKIPPISNTATILRSIPFASITGAMRARLPGLAAIARGFDEWAGEQSGTSAPARPSVSDHTLRRRKRLDNAHYEEVAKVYREAKTRPRAAVADHFYVANSTAARWGTECRERGLLPKTSRGRAAR